MANSISATDLSALMQGKSKFALIDVCEAGEYNSSHIADSSLISRKELEFRMDVSAPVRVRSSSSGTTTAAGRPWPPPR